MARWIYRTAKYMLFLLGWLIIVLWQTHPATAAALLDAPLFRILVPVLGLLCLLLLGALISVSVSLLALLTHSSEQAKGVGRDCRLPGEAVVFPVANDQKPGQGIYFEAAGAKGTILVCISSIDGFPDFVQIGASLWQAGYHVLLLPFSTLRGATRKGVQPLIGMRDIQEIMAGITYAKLRAPGTHLGVLGYRAGGAAAILAAAQTSALEAIVADSSFCSAWKVAEQRLHRWLRRQKRLPLWLLRLLYIVTDLLLYWSAGYHLQQVAPTLAVAQLAPRPVLLIAGQDDPLGSAEDARSLYQVAKKPRSLCLFDHSDAHRVHSQAYLATLLVFFKETLGPGVSTSTHFSDLPTLILAQDSGTHPPQAGLKTSKPGQSAMGLQASIPTIAADTRAHSRLARPSSSWYAVRLYRWRWWILGSFLATLTVFLAPQTVSANQTLIRTQVLSHLVTFPEALILPVAIAAVILVSRSLPAALLSSLQAMITTIVAIGMLHLVIPQVGNQFILQALLILTPALSVSFSLVLLSCLREAQSSGWHGEQALTRALAASTRPIVWSGTTLFFGFACLLLGGPGNTTSASIGMAGMIGTLNAMGSSLTLFPAALSILGRHLNRFSVKGVSHPFRPPLIGHPIRRHTPVPPAQTLLWRYIAQGITRRPWIALLTAFVILGTGEGLALFHGVSVFPFLDGGAGRSFLLLALSAFVILFLMLRTLALPLKAILLALFSLQAATCFAGLLLQTFRLTPQGGSASTIALLFAGPLFSLAIGQEGSLLLSFKDEQGLGHPDREGIVASSSKSGQILFPTMVLSLAESVTLVCLPTLLAKEAGVSLAAFALLSQGVIGPILSTAFLQVLGRWRWWSPSFLTVPRLTRRPVPAVQTEEQLPRAQGLSAQPPTVAAPPRLVEQVEQTLMLLFSQTLGWPPERIRGTTHFFTEGVDEERTAALLAGISQCYSLQLTANDIKASPILYRLAASIARKVARPGEIQPVHPPAEASGVQSREETSSHEIPRKEGVSL